MVRLLAGWFNDKQFMGLEKGERISIMSIMSKGIFSGNNINNPISYWDDAWLIDLLKIVSHQLKCKIDDWQSTVNYTLS